MLKITAKAKVKKENKEAFLEVAKVLIDASRKEEGNVSYGLFEDVEDSTTITFIEEWKDQEAVNIHGESAHFKHAVEELGKLFESFEINVYKGLL